MRRLTFHPATAARWKDLETLFGERGACGGCWCMYWRLKRSEFEERKGAGNRGLLRRLVRSGKSPGILAYSGDQPIGWCAVAPRDEYPVLDRSRVLARLDSEPVWSVTCFFVARPFRRKGITVKLLRAAVTHARQQGARIVEGYPLDPKGKGAPDVFAWTGFISAFRKAGFREVDRRSPTRPIMRRGRASARRDRPIRREK